MGKTKPRKKQALTENTGALVLSAIKKLMTNTGWTARTIIKFIKIEYRISDPKISGKVSRALKRGVRLGMLQMARGRYRLNEMAKLARQVSATDIQKNHKSHRPLALRIHSRPNSCASFNSMDNYRSKRKT